MLVTPKVYMVGQSVMIFDGIRKYLQYTGQDEFLETLDAATDEGLSDAECLCSMFAKLCYKSLILGENKNVSRIRDIPDNIRGTFDQGHGCYDSETDVLTAEGWKPWPDVEMTDKLATLRPDTHSIEYHHPIRLICNEYKGRMYRVESRSVDLLVTPNHRMFVCPTTTKEGRRKLTYKFVNADELGHKPHAYLKTGNWPGGSWGNYPGRDVLSLLGFAIGDGHGQSSGTIRFHLRKERKIAWLRALCCRLESSGFELRSNMNYDRYEVVIPSNDFMRSLFFDMYDLNGEKQIPPKVLMNSSIDGLEGLLEGLLQSDGSVGESTVSFYTTSPHLPGQFQQLCLHVGLAANQGYTYTSEDRPSSYGSKSLTRLNVIRRFLRPEINKHAGGEGVTKWVDDWEGDVYCAEVPNGTLYVRRGGRPVWCGNSVWEHCVINFIATDVSRVLTHELVRHRAGWAYSQTSGRYVRGDDLDLVFDPILDPVKKEIENITGIIKEHYLEMVAKLGLDEMTDFAKKKKLTSALRRILPNGQSNEIAFSVNLRSLRHFVMVRTSRHAEWEIRVVAEQVYDLVKARFPLVFYGAKEEVVEGVKEISGMRLQPYEKGDG